MHVFSRNVLLYNIRKVIVVLLLLSLLLLLLLLLLVAVGEVVVMSWLVTMGEFAKSNMGVKKIQLKPP
jgi:hypothetical protein